MPSAVQSRRERRRSAFWWTAAVRPVVAFTMRLGRNQSGMGRIIKAKELWAKKTVALARRLLGEQLVRRPADGRVEAWMIVETEA